MTNTKTATSTSITIRRADAHDAPALARLAQLDARRVPAGDLLVAEAGGDLRAALAIRTGAHVADPFTPTQTLVRLLELRAERLRGEPLTLGARIRARLPFRGAPWRPAALG